MHDEQLYLEAEQVFTSTLLTARKILIARAREIHPKLHAPGFRLIQLLGVKEPQQQGALAELLDLDKATISRMIKQLEDMGLVQRTPDPHDGRAQLVSMTEAARTNWNASAANSSQKIRARLQSWDTEDVQRLITLLRRLSEPQNGESHT